MTSNHLLAFLFLILSICSTTFMYALNSETTGQVLLTFDTVIIWINTYDTF